MGLSDASKEAIYLRGMIEELGMKIRDRTPIYNDSQGVIKLAENPVHHARSKHIDIRYHFVCESLSNGLISINYVPNDEMLADIFTKGLNRIKHLRLMEGLNLKPCHISPRGGVKLKTLSGLYDSAQYRRACDTEIRPYIFIILNYIFIIFSSLYLSVHGLLPPLLLSRILYWA